MRHSEYGGYLPAENDNREYYYDTLNMCVCRLNAARYGIVEACKELGCNCVYIPYYLCSSVCDALEKNNIQHKKYNINSSFEPLLQDLDSDSMVVIVNYYGIFNDSFYSNMKKRFKNIIFDNTQSFFSSPIIADGIYNVYSPRKFVGVSDGAYLISQNIRVSQHYPRDCSSDRFSFVFKSLENGTNSNYKAFLAAEEDLCSGTVMEMSSVTRCLLSNINYKKVFNTRKENFHRMCQKLNAHNLLSHFCTNADDSISCCPMVYPLLLERDCGKRVREYLIDNKVYVSQWWKVVMDYTEANDFEKWLSEDLIPLPIDQRYGLEDMDELAKMIMEII